MTDYLVQHINSYFQLIIDEIINHGGDVLKFAGDAVFAEWRIKNNDYPSHQQTSKENSDDSLEMVRKAAACGADIVAKCSEYPVFDRDGMQISTLNVHCGLAYGEMAGVHVGNDYSRREYIVMGESIDQVTKACDAATYGELMASPEAHEILKRRKSHLFGSYNPLMKGGKEPILIASRNENYLLKKKRSFPQKKRKAKSNQSKGRDDTVKFDKMDVTSLRYLKKLLSLYVHPVVVSDESSSMQNSEKDAKAIQEIHRSEVELRSVYTLFIKPIVDVELSKEDDKNQDIFKTLNDILQVVISILDGFRGHLRQFIVDDKGTFNIDYFVFIILGNDVI